MAARDRQGVCAIRLNPLLDATAAAIPGRLRHYAEVRRQDLREVAIRDEIVGVPYRRVTAALHKSKDSAEWLPCKVYSHLNG